FSCTLCATTAPRRHKNEASIPASLRRSISNGVRHGRSGRATAIQASSTEGRGAEEKASRRGSLWFRTGRCKQGAGGKRQAGRHPQRVGAKVIGTATRRVLRGKRAVCVELRR